MYNGEGFSLRIIAIKKTQAKAYGYRLEIYKLILFHKTYKHELFNKFALCCYS